MSSRRTRSSAKSTAPSVPLVKPTAKPRPAPTPAPSPSPAPAGASSRSSGALPTLPFADATAWETWLEAQDPLSPGVWLKIGKKSGGIPSVSYDQALDVALCHGWIDGQRRSLDDKHFVQRFTPRRRNSNWSKRNVDKVAVLTEAGRMRPSGQAEVDAARADGRWERAYSSPSNIQASPEFRAALAGNKDALAFFGDLNKTQRYTILLRLETAKKAETKERLVAQFVAMLARGEVL